MKSKVPRQFELSSPAVQQPCNQIGFGEKVRKFRRLIVFALFIIPNNFFLTSFAVQGSQAIRIEFSCSSAAVQSAMISFGRIALEGKIRKFRILKFLHYSDFLTTFSLPHSQFSSQQFKSPQFVFGVPRGKIFFSS